MNDDDQTPPRQITPRPHTMSDSQRDARRAELQTTTRRRWPGTVPAARQEPEEVTAPIDVLLDGQLTAEDYARIDQLRRSEHDLSVLVWNVAKALERYRREERSGSTAIRDQVIAAVDESQRQLAAIARRLDGFAGVHGRLGLLEADMAVARDEIGERQTTTKGSIHENLNRLLGTHRTARWLAGVALAAALSAATYVVAAIRNGGADEIRLNRAERDIEQTQTDLRDIRRELRRKDP